MSAMTVACLEERLGYRYCSLRVVGFVIHIQSTFQLPIGHISFSQASKLPLSDQSQLSNNIVYFSLFVHATNQHLHHRPWCIALIIKQSNLPPRSQYKPTMSASGSHANEKLANDNASIMSTNSWTSLLKSPLKKSAKKANREESPREKQIRREAMHAYMSMR